MIKSRPTRLNDFGNRVSVPTEPFSVTWEVIPEVVRLSLMPLSGIQPVTGAMFGAAGGDLHTAPSTGEIDHFRDLGTQFQMIQVVLSLAWQEVKDGIPEVVPFGVSAIPASKRGKVTTTSIDGVAALKGAPASNKDVYVGFDPFTGEWSMYSHAEIAASLVSGKPLDELGIVIERYFLALDYDRDDVTEFDTFIPDEQSKKAYRRNRLKKLFAPFTEVRARRLWGLETQIELFLFQELLSRGIKPQCQHLIYPDGSTYQSLYDVYADIEFRRGQNILTEVDMFLPNERLAVFCDGAHHERRKQRQKDAQIDAKLKEIGIESVRVPGRLINADLKGAGDRVSEVLP